MKKFRCFKNSISKGVISHAPICVNTYKKMMSVYYRYNDVDRCDIKYVFTHNYELCDSLIKDFGEDVPSAELNVDPWKLLEALALQLGLFSASGFYLAHMLLSGRRFASKSYSSNIPSGQQIAKERATSAPITVIWGPPGTGKTHTISEIAIDFLKKNKRVLLVSQSNVSVDGMTQKIAQLMKQQGMEELFSQGVVLRYGHTRTEALSAHPYLTSMQFAATQNPEIKREIERLQKEIKTLSAFDSNSRSKSLVFGAISGGRHSWGNSGLSIGTGALLQCRYFKRSRCGRAHHLGRAHHRLPKNSRPL